MNIQYSQQDPKTIDSQAVVYFQSKTDNLQDISSSLEKAAALSSFAFKTGEILTSPSFDDATAPRFYVVGLTKQSTDDFRQAAGAAGLQARKDGVQTITLVVSSDDAQIHQAILTGWWRRACHAGISRLTPGSGSAKRRYIMQS